MSEWVREREENEDEEEWKLIANLREECFVFVWYAYLYMLWKMYVTCPEMKLPTNIKAHVHIHTHTHQRKRNENIYVWKWAIEKEKEYTHTLFVY